MNIGFTYNAILNNFGFTFEILPNLLAMGRQRARACSAAVPAPMSSLFTHNRGTLRMALMAHVPPKQEESIEARRPRRRWREEFRDALRGLRRGVRGHSSFFVHFFATAIVILAAFAFHCHLVEWSILIGCIGGVLTAELFNSAIETFVRGMEPAQRENSRPVLDIAAGAVLMASITAAVIGGLIFGARLLDVLGW